MSTVQMVGLSIVLESTGQKGIINKSTIIIKNPPITAGSAGFLDYCSLCRRKLLPANDIYMYKGDRAFCSEECRCRQIFMDEEEDDDIVRRSHLKENCGFTAMISQASPSSGAAGATSSSTSTSTSSSGSRKGRNRGGATGTAYI